MGATTVARKTQDGTAAKPAAEKSAIYVTQAELAHALVRAGRAIDRHAAIEAFRAVRIFTDDEDRVVVEVRGHSHNVVRLELDLDASFVGDVDRLVDHAKLKDMIKPFNKLETLTLRPLKAGLEVRSGQARFSVREAKRDDWPKLPALLGAGHDSTPVVPVHTYGEPFGEVIAAAATHASRDGGGERPILTGVRLEATGKKATVVATDSYRLAIVDAENLFAEDCDLLLPATAMHYAVQGFGRNSDEGVMIEDYGHHVVVVRDGERWSIRKIEGTYPNWQQLLPGHPAFTVTVETERLYEAAKSAARVAVKNVPLRITVQKTQLKLLVRVPDEGDVFKDTISSKASPAPEDGFEIGFNPSFFADALAVLTTDEAELEFLTPKRPVMVNGGTDRVLLMPITLNV
jgi:DNA polymerase-3 subunit beta